MAESTSFAWLLRTGANIGFRSIRSKKVCITVPQLCGWMDGPTRKVKPRQSSVGTAPASQSGGLPRARRKLDFSNPLGTPWAVRSATQNKNKTPNRQKKKNKKNKKHHMIMR